MLGAGAGGGLLALPAEVLVPIVLLAAAASSSSTVEDVDLATLVTLAQTCTHLRALVLTHFFHLNTRRQPRSLGDALRARAISHAWAATNAGGGTLRLRSANLDLPNATGPRAQPVRPIVLRLPPLASSQGEDGGEDEEGVHLLLFFRAQVMYWAKRSSGRWLPDPATPLTILGRPSAAQHLPSDSEAHPSKAPPSNRRRGTGRGGRGAGGRRVAASSTTESFGGAGRIANISLDAASLTGAENPWQDVTSAVVLPLREQDKVTARRASSIVLALGRRDGSIQLATLTPPPPSTTRGTNPSASRGSEGNGTLELHPVLPYRFSNDIQAMDVRSLSRHRHACLLAVGSKGGHLAILQIRVREHEDEDEHEHGRGSSDRPSHSTSPTHSQNLTDEVTAPDDHLPAITSSPLGKSKSKSALRRERRLRGQLRRQGGAGKIAPEPIPSATADPPPRAPPIVSSSVPTHDPTRPSAAASTTTRETATTGPEVSLLIHRNLAADYSSTHTPSSDSTATTATMTIWSLRFLGSEGVSFAGTRTDGPVSPTWTSQTGPIWLAVGTTGIHPLLIYDLRPWTSPTALAEELPDGAPLLLRIAHPRFLAEQESDPEWPTPDTHQDETTAQTGDHDRPHTPSAQLRRPTKSSIFALSTIRIPRDLLQALSTRRILRPSLSGETSSSSISVQRRIGPELLIAGYYDGTVALFIMPSVSPSTVQSEIDASIDSQPQTPQHREAQPRLLLQLEDPSTQDAQYSLRAFWHMPILRRRTLARPLSTSSTVYDGPSDQDEDEDEDDDGDDELPTLRVLAGSARFGCVRVWEVSGRTLVRAIRTHFGRMGERLQTAQEGHDPVGPSLAPAPAPTAHSHSKLDIIGHNAGYTGMTLFPSFPWQTSLRRRRAHHHDDDKDANEPHFSLPSNAASSTPSTSLTTTSTTTTAASTTTHKVGPTYTLALDGDANVDLDADSDIDIDIDGDGGDGGDTGGGANAGGRVWGTNERGVWMLDFVPRRRRHRRQHQRGVGTKTAQHQHEDGMEKDGKEGDEDEDEDEEDQQAVVLNQIGYYLHDGVRMDLRLSVDPWT